MAPHSSTLALENPMDRAAWWAAVHGVARVGHDWATSLSRIGEGNGNPLQYSCLENPMDRGAWWAAVHGVDRVGHDWATSLSLFTFMHWRRKWQPTPVFLPGESQGRGSLAGCRLWGRTESDTTEAMQQQQQQHIQQKKQTHRYREQSSGYQWRELRTEAHYNGGWVGDISYWV